LEQMEDKRGMRPDETARCTGVAKRKRGAPLGNLNAGRISYRTYWRRRVLRKDDRWVLRLVQDYVPELVTDLGGDPSAQQKRTIEICAAARVCWLLALAAQDLETVARFHGIEARFLLSLGLERRARQLPRLAERFAERPLPLALPISPRRS
jgi:hypothetical protein